MPRDPRIRLRNAAGNIVGTFYETASGEIALHHEPSDTELHIDGDGLDVAAVTSDDVSSNTVSAATAMDIPEHSGSDPAEGNIWIRTDIGGT